MATPIGGSPPPDVLPPSAPVGLVASAGSGSVALAWGASSDNVGVVRYDVFRSTVSGFTPSPANRVGQPPGTGYSDAGLAAGTYFYVVEAADAAGNLSPPSNEVSASVTAPPPGPAGLVAAYAFAEAGTQAPDASGKGNNGTVTNTSWTAAGKFGGALSFNGSSSWVTIPDAPSLDLTTGMTLEAWVNPAALGPAWRTVIFKEQPGETVYSLYAHDGARPRGQLFLAGEQDALGSTALPLNVWTHLAATYDGSTLRLFVNGVQAGSKTVSGSLPASSGALRIGGNSIWGEYFSGLIDEIRIYNRALTPTELQTDMATPIQ